MPTESEFRSRRDSWPPTQVRLKPTVSTKDDPLPSLDDIDEDPLTYFLTPAPDFGDDDMDQAMMDFDAGIEDSSHPHDVVRSVSPSTLDGLRKPGLRSVSPDTSSEIDTPDDDDDEDYIRFSPSPNGLLSLHDLFMNNSRSRPKSPAFGQSSNALLLPSSPQLRGRVRGRGRNGQSRTVSSRHRPSQLWREPSPDVWSIEEETEEELMSDLGSSVGARSDIGDHDENREHGGVKVSKPKKKVRFVLPAKVD
ncbi:Fc.00g003770.m01.CDS01 [Cosmosporella sp. VM-42]